MDILIVLLALVTIVLLVFVLGLLFALKKSGQNTGVDAMLCQMTLLEEELKRLAEASDKEARTLREEVLKESRLNREEMTKHLTAANETIHSQMGRLGEGQQGQLERLTRSNEEKMERLRSTVDQKLTQMQVQNEKKLEEMRLTVDEKLSQTLNRRLGESFNLVSERLEQVSRGLGEMQSLSTNLTDIKKIFGNVKSRGVWGEVQLAAILEQILTPEQYAANVCTVPRSNDKVEFALRLPGQDGEIVYLPIDAKFPSEDYQRLLSAQEAGDAVTVEAARKALQVRLKNEAKQIHDKYINPPVTTEYGIMFLPTEGLFAEALRLPDFMEYAQNQCQVMVAGPTNLAALLNSIRLGFRTLAIQEKSGEIKKLLGAIKTDMGKFALLVEKTQKKLGEADKALGEAAKRTGLITKKLRDIEALPETEGQQILPLDNEESE